MFRKAIGLPRTAKSLIILAADFVLLPAALWAAIALRMDDWSYPRQFAWWVFLLPSLIATPIFIKLGLYRAVIRYIEDRAVITIASAVSLATLGFITSLQLFQVMGVPRGSLLIFWLLAMAIIISSRFVARAILRRLAPLSMERKSVLIYGAGSAGRQLAVALRTGQEYEPVGFVDDARDQQGLQIGGLRVLSNAQMLNQIEAGNIDQVLLAIPSAPRSRQIELVNQLEPLAVEVRILPGMADLVSGEVRLADAREVGVDELLGREPVPPNKELLARNIAGKVVMVTGAGGSIGSELCRQIIKNQPVALVLYELSEFALYSIEQELSHMIREQALPIAVHPVLGSVQNGMRLAAIMARYQVQTVYHAAAYKHVPLVEFNITEGILNNAFGTRSAAAAAIEAGVESFVLISTDKAVRPTNVMGASKRMAELALQAYALDPTVKTRFSMVRFGNVLGSSGSVVPLFRKQIAAGGPVKVTHPEINRFFMTIPEASQLVIQAGAMGGNGEVFVLDMGSPVRIVDLARRMIHLSGYRVRDDANPNGDIAIEFSGLRPGEKLYEELLIGDNVSGTEHPRIMKANESCLTLDELEQVIADLGVACVANDSRTIIEILQRCVSGFKPDQDVRDHLYEFSDHL
ncbi:polysaccharide biosynthesis protein [Chitinibacter bivalviorum]|uniref:Polysaccharide biosynthesis protein n=1 Tax=Chitinibacter bivalviorum TaxID=2739434 RepID=A0A7H9BGE5_9NEIS|nr:nucleoside-diphosphate sugar epimerase/dehydratase [Chitinibacter bivalviorum]QLG87011.1 polysaccharide biosynthesis protein [Chitinibacter bivalviorum]